MDTADKINAIRKDFHDLNAEMTLIVTGKEDRVRKAINKLRGSLAVLDADLPEDGITTAYREAARNVHVVDGTIEVDDTAIVSQSEDGGAYVAAWVWVDDSDANVCAKCRAELTDDGEGYDGKCGACMDVEDAPSE